MESKPKVRVHVRWCIRRDMNSVLDIENQSFTNPWSEEEFLTKLRARNTIGMVAEHDNKVLGSMVYELHRNRITVLNFAVHTDFRRMGVGTAMLDKLKSKLFANRRTRLELLVRETELDGLLFLKQNGFRATELIRGHYENSGEDAIQMVYTTPVEDCVSEEKPHKPVNRVFRHANGDLPW